MILSLLTLNRGSLYSSGSGTLTNSHSNNNFTMVDFKFYRELMIKNLIPYSTKDLTINKSLLLENNFDTINAIDWDKGCYIGQEITARMKYRALLKKSIRAIEIISGKVKFSSFHPLNSQTGFINSIWTDSFEFAATRQLKISISTPLISKAALVAECFQ